MKAVVCVVVYNRVENIKKWIHVWKKAKIKNAELRIIHNVHQQEHIDRIQDIVEKSGIKYIPRINVGMDIGAFQDICLKRINGFEYNFEYMIWMTDDTYPMRDSFIDEFIGPLDGRTGMTCFEISNQIRPHVRTTGFCLRAETLNKITFDVPQIMTKDDCYNFEHRSAKNLFMQIRFMHLDVMQLSPVKTSPVWDSGGGGIQWPDRNKEFLDYWNIDYPPAKVIIISPAYVKYPVIAASMISQTYQNWELHLIHSGPAPQDYPKFTDKRIKFTELPNNRKEYGHPTRIEWLEKIKSGKIVGDYVVVTNDDNYHAPYFLEKLIKPLELNQELVGSYCSEMVHNYQGYGDEIIDPSIGHAIDGYGIIKVKPERGYIDCACAVIRSKEAAAVGWPSTRHSSDWDYLNIIAMRSGGWNRFKKVNGCLLTHN